MDRWSDRNRLRYIAQLVWDAPKSIKPYEDTLQRIYWLAEGTDEFLEINKDNFKDVLGEEVVK